MKAKSIFGRSVQEVEEKLNEEFNTNINPTLAIVFMSNKDEVDSVSEILDKKNISVFGVTANREFTDEEIDSDLITLLLLDINASYFSIAYETYKNGEADKAANEVASKGLELFSSPAFIVSSSHVNSPIDDILLGIKSVAGNDAIISGGISSDDDLVNGGLVFTNNMKGSNAVLSLIIDTDKIGLTGYAVSGWKPMGISKKITRSERNRVFTIDNEPALDVLIRYTGLEVDMEDISDVFTQIGTAYPFQVQKEKG
ncbi:MAG: FIST N-terminal domain-containing protein, partial [Melioribacteraceae bacterium]|nr:FIST N-terminal domain-containing protein [Melioribacteraceae bacterium]